MRWHLQAWLIVLAGSIVVISCVTLVQYALDKRQARRDGWRIPEKRLHILSLLGGWPGALLGQRWLRHKSVKARFRIIFWLTVVGHLVIAGGLTYVVWCSLN